MSAMPSMAWHYGRRGDFYAWATTCEACAAQLAAERYWVALSRGSFIAYLIAVVLYVLLASTSGKMVEYVLVLFSLLSFVIFAITFFLVRVRQVDDVKLRE